MAANPRGVTVTVCRGCCCGSAVKHPQVDHEGMLEMLRTAAEQGGGGVLRVVNCLDECERSNVVAVRRRRSAGAEVLWFGPLNDEAVTEALAAWLRDGAVGEVPDELSALLFTKRPARPPIAVRYERGEEESLVCPALRPALADSAAGEDG
jgi:predicted metal-binding protein